MSKLAIPLAPIAVDSPYNGGVPLPRSMAKLHPEAAVALEAWQGEMGAKLILTDAYRSPEQSLRAIADGKRGVQPPGFSAHNFGVAVDVDVDGTCARWGTPYPLLLQTAKAHGFHCHRRDRDRGFEDWHFNYLGGSADACLASVDERLPRTWSAAAEARIVELFGADLALDPSETQAALAQLGFYGGLIDGILGPRSRDAMLAFKRAWRIPVTVVDFGPRTLRTLAVVAAAKVIA